MLTCYWCVQKKKKNAYFQQRINIFIALCLAVVISLKSPGECVVCVYNRTFIHPIRFGGCPTLTHGQPHTRGNVKTIKFKNGVILFVYCIYDYVFFFRQKVVYQLRCLEHSHYPRATGLVDSVFMSLHTDF